MRQKDPLHIKAPHINGMLMRNRRSLLNPDGLVSRTAKASESYAFHRVCYLFVGLRKQNADSLHRRAGEAQRAGLAAVARGRVDALHSGEAGVKLTLQEGERRGERRTVERRRELQNACGPRRESRPKLLGLMTLWLMQKRECGSGGVLK